MTRFLTWLMLGKRAARRTLILGSAIALSQYALLLIAAFFDDNAWLPGAALGLLEHPGIPAIVVADFVVLATLGFAARRFLRLPRRLPVVDQPMNRRLLRRYAHRGRAAILLRGRARTFLWFCMGVGFLFWLLNALQTTDPTRFYGRDVFDSSSHLTSYISFRIVLWISWVVLYPYAAVAFLGMAGNLYMATRTLLRRGQLVFALFHPDRCGGFSVVGDISFAAIMSVAALYGSLTTVILTHHRLNVLQVSAFLILSCGLVMFSYFIAWPITRFMWRRRRAVQARSYRKLMRGPDLFAALQLGWATLATSYSPYVAYQRVLINGARMLPVLLAALRLSKTI